MNPIPTLLQALADAYAATPPDGLPSGFSVHYEIAATTRERPCAVITSGEEDWLHTRMVRFPVAVEIRHRADTAEADAAAAAVSVVAIEAAFPYRLMDALAELEELGWVYRTCRFSGGSDGPDADGWTFRREWSLTLCAS